MKQVLCLLSLLLLMGCSKDEGEYCVDWSPVGLTIQVKDAAGNNLVNSAYKGVTLTFKGKTYEVQSMENRSTRAYCAVMYGLCLDNSEAPSCLKFGEIDGASDMDEDLVLNWSDGTRNTIHYHCGDHEVNKHGKASCDRSWTLDGEKHEGNCDPCFTFVK